MTANDFGMHDTGTDVDIGGDDTSAGTVVVMVLLLAELVLAPMSLMTVFMLVMAVPVLVVVGSNDNGIGGDDI